jgi:hypothetical protein
LFNFFSSFFMFLSLRFQDFMINSRKKRSKLKKSVIFNKFINY